MKRKELLEHIKKNMPKNLNEIEIAAYIAKEIALKRDFSARYYWSTKETRDKIYNLARDNNQIQLQDKKELICVTACKLYEYIARQYGMDIYFKGDKNIITKSDYSIFESGEHIFPIVKLKDGRYIKVDVEWDLENIKTGLKWIKFGTIDENEGILSTIPEDELELIMHKIGYKNKEEKYLNQHCKQLYNNKAKDLSTYERLNLIFNDPTILQNAGNLTGSVEIYRFYRQLIKDFTRETKQYNNTIFIFGVAAKPVNCENPKYTICTYFKDENQKNIWLYSKKLGKNIEISPKELAYYVKNNQISMVAGKSGEALENLQSYIEIFDEKEEPRSIDEMVI